MISKIEISGARSNNIFGNGENKFVAFSPSPNMILLDYVYHLTLYIIFFIICAIICVYYWKQKMKILKQSKQALTVLVFRLIYSTLILFEALLCMFFFLNWETSVVTRQYYNLIVNYVLMHNSFWFCHLRDTLGSSCALT